jgi:hypothetical protein
MSYNITGTTITLTRGDTFEALVSATKRDGTQYIPVAGDTIRFAMKENYDDPRPLLVKDIPIDTMMLTLEPQDTADLNFGKYVYDIQLTKANGKLDCDIYEGEYNIVPSDTVQVLPTADKLLKHDIVIEANSGGLPEGSEMATDDDIDSLIDDIFGTGVNPDPDEPTYSPDDIATEKELNDAITDVFG